MPIPQIKNMFTNYIGWLGAIQTYRPNISWDIAVRHYQ